MPVRRKHIRSLTNRLLERFGVDSAPVPVEQIAEALGATVRREAAEDELSGFLVRDRARKTAVIGVNATHHPNRQNFTVGHELGHFLLHEGDDVHVDRRFQVKLRNQVSSEGTDEEEKEANLFAAEIIMPQRLVEEDVAEIDAIDLDDEQVIADLAKLYGVSTQAMTFRLSYLGYIQL